METNPKIDKKISKKILNVTYILSYLYLVSLRSLTDTLLYKVPFTGTGKNLSTTNQNLLAGLRCNRSSSPNSVK